MAVFGTVGTVVAHGQPLPANTRLKVEWPDGSCRCSLLPCFTANVHHKEIVLPVTILCGISVGFRPRFRNHRRKQRGLKGLVRHAATTAGEARRALDEALGQKQPLRKLPKGTEMRPLVVAMGTRGDVEPCLRVASQLRSRGHAPLVFTHKAFENEVLDVWGLDFESCGIDKVPLSQEYLTGKTRADQVFTDRGWYGDAWVDVGQRMYNATLQHRCDVILSTSMGNTHALDVAEKEEVICFALKFCPDIDGQVPTAAFAPSGYPSGMPAMLNYVAHVVENFRTVAAVFAGGFIPRVIEFRSMLGFPSLKIDGQGLLPVRVMDDIEVPTYSPYRTILQANQPCFYAFSKALVDRPPDYQPWHFMTGSMGRVDAHQNLQLPASVTDFLDMAESSDGMGPVCIAFGSMTLARSAPFQSRAVAAARQLGRHVIVVDPQGSDGVMSDDPKVLCARSLPYAALFPRCCLIVHHGGAGTLQDSLWAGAPQLIAPVLSWSDQPFWAQALQDRGLGVSLGSGGVAPELEAWSQALSVAFDSLKSLRAKAHAVAVSAEEEQGPEMVCDILEEVLLL